MKHQEEPKSTEEFFQKILEIMKLRISQKKLKTLKKNQ